MLNQFILVGRLEDMPKDSTITLAVNRPYKNEDGIYETDFIKISVPNGILVNLIDYCKKGDLVGVRGRVETDKLVCDKLTFLSSNN